MKTPDTEYTTLDNYLKHNKAFLRSRLVQELRQTDGYVVTNKTPNPYTRKTATFGVIPKGIADDGRFVYDIKPFGFHFLPYFPSKIAIKFSSDGIVEKAEVTVNVAGKIQDSDLTNWAVSTFVCSDPHSKATRLCGSRTQALADFNRLLEQSTANKKASFEKE